MSKAQCDEIFTRLINNQGQNLIGSLDTLKIIVDQVWSNMKLKDLLPIPKSVYSSSLLSCYPLTQNQDIVAGLYSRIYSEDIYRKQGNAQVFQFKKLAVFYDLMNMLNKDLKSDLVAIINQLVFEKISTYFFDNKLNLSTADIEDQFYQLTQKVSISSIAKEMKLYKQYYDKRKSKQQFSFYCLLNKECTRTKNLKFLQVVRNPLYSKPKLNQNEDSNIQILVMEQKEQSWQDKSFKMSINESSVSQFKQKVISRLENIFNTFLTVFDYVEKVSFQSFIPILYSITKNIQLAKILFMKYKINTRVVKASLQQPKENHDKIENILIKEEMAMLNPLSKDLMYIFGLDTPPISWTIFFQVLQTEIQQLNVQGKLIDHINFFRRLDTSKKDEISNIEEFFRCKLVRNDIQSTVKKYLHQYSYNFGVPNIENLLPETRNFTSLDFYHLQEICKQKGFTVLKQFIENEIHLIIFEAFQSFGLQVRFQDFRNIQKGTDIQELFINEINKQFINQPLLMQTLLAFNIKSIYQLLFDNLSFNAKYNTFKFVTQDLNNINIRYFQPCLNLACIQMMSRIVQQSVCLQRHAQIVLADRGQQLTREMIICQLNCIFDTNDYTQIIITNSIIKQRVEYCIAKYENLLDLYYELFDYLRQLILSTADINISRCLSYKNYINDQKYT